MGASKSDVAVSEVVRPTVGRIVHFVATPALVAMADGHTEPDVRAMLITNVLESSDGEVRVNGQVYRSGPSDTDVFPALTMEVTAIPEDQLEMKVGTWHWPPRS